MNKEGSLWGGALLLTGSCVGAGMLGLPILTGLAGFFPALTMFFLAWIFMTTTGLLLVEADGWFPGQVNLLSMFGKSLGKIGKICCWMLYLFLFYALLVAYISASGSLFSTFLTRSFPLQAPAWLGSVLLVAFFGTLVFRGTRQVDLWNRVLMAGKIFFFVCLLAAGLSHVQPSFLLRTDLSVSLFSLPILLISFGFHNMIPSLTAYFHRDLRKVRQAIWLGGGLTFLIYLLWEVLVLGVVPLQGETGLLSCYLQDKEGAQALSGLLPTSGVPLFAQALAFCAILTSFLAQSLSFVHFLADGLHISYRKKESIPLCLLVLLPPLILSLLYPKMFFQALDFAGGICAVVLFGIMPALAIWKGRYLQHHTSAYQLTGGKTTLSILILFSLFVFYMQLSQMLSFLPFWKIDLTSLLAL